MHTALVVRLGVHRVRCASSTGALLLFICQRGPACRPFSVCRNASGCSMRLRRSPSLCGPREIARRGRPPCAMRHSLPWPPCVQFPAKACSRRTHKAACSYDLSSSAFGATLLRNLVEISQSLSMLSAPRNLQVARSSSQQCVISFCHHRDA
ncbi:hypothetical protein C2E23DRAFT_844499 [Lenzites betulinus]|nr:hypothetical protein C2E23DRAFT_844499 [Lenzites betulinus]